MPSSKDLMPLLAAIHIAHSAGPEVHKLVMADNPDDAAIHAALLAHGNKLMDEMRASAGQAAPAPADGKSKGSTAKRAHALARQFEANEPAKADSGAADRRAKLGRIFDGKK